MNEDRQQVHAQAAAGSCGLIELKSVRIAGCGTACALPCSTQCARLGQLPSAERLLRAHLPVPGCLLALGIIDLQLFWSVEAGEIDEI